MPLDQIDVDNLPDEIAQEQFVTTFRELLRSKNLLESFVDFQWEDLDIAEQTFTDFEGKYIDLYEKIKKQDKTAEKTSILAEIDFELILIHRDDINLSYILTLLAQLNTASAARQAEIRQQIQNALTSQIQLRSKRTLIENFIEQQLPFIHNPDMVAEAFETYRTEKRELAFAELVATEQLNIEATRKLISGYAARKQNPVSDTLGDLFIKRPSFRDIAQRRQQLLEKIQDFIDTYFD